MNVIQVKNIYNKFYWAILLIGALMLFACNMLGQSESDSMQRMLKEEKVDSNRVKLLLELANIQRYNKPDEAFLYSERAYSISRKTDDERGQAEALYIMAFTSYKIGKNEECFKYADKGIAIYNALKDSSGLIKCYIIKSVGHMVLNDYSKAVVFLNTSIELAKKTGDLNAMAIAYNNLGLIYDEVDDLPKAIEMYEKAMRIDSLSNNQVGIGFGYNNMGKLYAKMGQMDKCIEFYLKSYSVFDKTEHIGPKSTLQNNLGEVYFEIKNYEKAKEHYINALMLKKEAGSPDKLASSYINLGKLYSEMNKPDSTFFCYQKADSLFKICKNKNGLAKLYLEYAKNFINKKQYVKAEDYLRSSITEREKINDLDGIAECYMLSTDLALKKNNLSKAENLINNAINIANKTQNTRIKADCFLQASKVMKLKGDFFEAYDFLNQYLIHYKELNEEKITKTTIELQTKYEVDLKNNEIASLNKENVANINLLNKEKERNRLEIILFILSGLIILSTAAFTFIFYRQNKQKKEVNSKLEEQKKYIEKQRDIITEELNQTIVKSEKLKTQNMHFQLEALKNQLNPHFLFNTFSTLINLIPENSQLAETYTRSLSNVYRYILTDKEKELSTVKKELDFIENYMFLVAIRFDDNVRLFVNVSDVDKTRNIPILSLQLLVENAVKHNIVSSKKPLDIYIEVVDDSLIVKNNLQLKNTVVNSTKTGLENINKRYQLLSERNVEIVKTRKEFVVKLPLL